jgi:hypothetical protein
LSRWRLATLQRLTTGKHVCTVVVIVVAILTIGWLGNMRSDDDEMVLRLEYYSDVYSRQFAERLCADFVELLSCVSEQLTTARVATLIGASQLTTIADGGDHHHHHQRRRRRRRPHVSADSVDVQRPTLARRVCVALQRHADRAPPLLRAIDGVLTRQQLYRAAKRLCDALRAHRVSRLVLLLPTAAASAAVAHAVVGALLARVGLVLVSSASPVRCALNVSRLS